MLTIDRCDSMLGPVLRGVELGVSWAGVLRKKTSKRRTQCAGQKEGGGYKYSI